MAEILRESIEYALGVSNSLKDQVYTALRHVAQGFLDYAPNQLLPDDPTTLKDIYDSSLIMLYRLLFILYAEARDLLPIQDSELYCENYSASSPAISPKTLMQAEYFSLTALASILLSRNYSVISTQAIHR